MRRRWFVSLGLLLLLLICFPQLATAATLSGFVRDTPNGQPVAHATVRLEPLSRSATRFANAASETGYFRFYRLPAGSYTLTVSAVGYQPKTQQITLTAEESVSLTLRLEPAPIDLPTLTVQGFLTNGTDRAARQLEQATINLVNVVAAETMEKSSDITIADVTQRVSGLSVLRDNTGQATKTIIRGTDPKYNHTLVNGIKIPSPDDRGRYVPLDIFPADMVQRIEVFKSLTPGLEGDAIGGVVNIVLNDAPRTAILKLKLTTGYHQTFFTRPYTSFPTAAIQTQSPAERYGPNYYATVNDFSQDNLAFRTAQPLPNGLGNLVWGRRLLNNRLGLLLVADYQQIKRGSSSTFIPQTAEPQLNNTPSLTDFYVRTFSTTLTRTNLHAKLDYALGNRHRLSLYQFWMNQREAETRFSVDTSLSQGRTIPGTGRITQLQRARVHDQAIYSTVLQGRHQLTNDLNARWSAAYSVATGAYPDWAELSASSGRLEATDHSIQTTPVLLSPLTRSWLRNIERDLSVYLDVSYSPAVFRKQVTVKAGGLFRQKNRTNFYTSYSFRPAITSAGGQLFTDIYGAKWADNGPLNPLGVVANPNTYTAVEQIGAGYVAAEINWGRWNGIAGLRLETTDQRFTSSIDPRTSNGKDVTISYADLLPSAAIKLSLSPAHQFRLAGFQSLSRPALYDLTFYSIQYEDYVEAGNPFLKRTRATNVELTYEHAPNRTDFWRLGGFYKQLTDPYERALLNTNDALYPIPDQGLTYTPAGQLTAQLRNFAPAMLMGGEVSLAKSIGNIGITANYTFTHSMIEQVKKVKVRENPVDATSNIITTSRSEIRPLQGQSPHLANLSVSYTHPAAGLRAQVSAVYTGKRIYAVSGWYGLDYWQRAYTQLDVSAEKQLGNHWQLFGKVNNLLNAATQVDLLQANPGFGSGSLPGQESVQYITVLQQFDKAMYYAGIRWNW